MFYFAILVYIFLPSLGGVFGRSIGLQSAPLAVRWHPRVPFFIAGAIGETRSFSRSAELGPGYEP